jgi:6-phosphogluconolactonase
MRPVTKQFKINEWPLRAARLIQDRINVICCEQGRCNVMLTGGRNAARLYMAWARLQSFQRLNRVSFYFGDERCVSPDHPESNYGMVMRTLFQRGVPEGCSVFRIEADDPDREAAVMRYGNALPKTINVMLLGVGEDGHIASIFPGSAALHEAGQRVLFITGPKPPYERFTVTYQVITQATSVFVLAAGAEKAAVLSRALQNPEDVDALPVRLVLNATWLLDTALPENVF